MWNFFDNLQAQLKAKSKKTKPIMRSHLLSLLLILLAFSVGAQPSGLVSADRINPEILNNHWKAQWINHPTVSAVDYGVFHFRKSFELSSVPKEFIIHISADNRYRLFVNGQAVCFGPARGDLAHWFYESIDISQYLKTGNNLLATIVWNFADEKPWAQFSLKTAL